MDEALDILAFAPHPDDAELGCAGSLIVASDKGWRVAVADLTEGEMSSRGTPHQRQQEKQRAAELLGLCARFSVDLPDSGIGTAPDRRRDGDAIVGVAENEYALANETDDGDAE